MDYREQYLIYKNKYNQLKNNMFGFSSGTMSGGGKKWMLFSDKERKQIQNAFDKIVKGDKECVKYYKKDVMKAVSGMYLNPEEPGEKKKEYLCSMIDQVHKEKKDPIVH